MVRRQKLISMTDHHFEVACEMPNFSKWVREQIEEYIQRSGNGPNDSEVRLYICTEGHESWYHPIKSSIRGWHYEIEKQCRECTHLAVRQ